MSDLDRYLAEPKPPALSAQFSQRVAARLPRSAAAPRSSALVRAYWVVFALFVIWQLASLPLPRWAAFALTPILLVALTTPFRSWVRLLAPMLR